MLFRILARLSPRPRPMFAIAYGFGVVMGSGFLIGSSPTLQGLLEPPFLVCWHVITLIGAVISLLGIGFGRGRVEMAGLWSLLSAVLVYASILGLAAARATDNPWTLVGLSGLALFAAGLTAARIGVIIELLRESARLDALGV